MGTVFEFLLLGENEFALRVAAEEAWEIVLELESILSRFNPQSDVSRVNRYADKGPVWVPPPLWEVLQIAERMYRLTGGAFDPTVGPLAACWGVYRREGRIPSDEERQEALARVGFDQVKMDPAQRTVRFLRPGMELDLGGIGKGFALQKAMQHLKACGVEAGLLHSGHSSVVAWGEREWPIGLEHPFRPGERVGVVLLKDRALSTSSLAEQRYVVGGETLGHLLDPRTGWPAKGLGSVTVIGTDAAEADALSTALFVMGLEAAQEFLQQHPPWAGVLMPLEGGEPCPFGLQLQLAESP